jgi:hypothetical protein
VNDLPDLQQAVRALPGVRAAVVRWPEPDAPAVLQVDFDPQADEEEVSRSVLATVERILGVGQNDLEVRRGGLTSSPHVTTPLTSPAEGVRNGQVPSRPVFSGLKVDRHQLETSIDVTISYDGRTSVGSAEGLATHQHVVLTAASAALSALRTFLPSDVRMQVEWVDVLDGAVPGRPTVVQVSVTCLRAGGEERLMGTAMARGDIREAAVRATLDALNRPLQRLAAVS